MKTQNSTSILVATLLTTIISGTGFAMAKKPINPEPPGAGESKTPVQREPAAISNPLTPADFDVFNEVAYPVGNVVDTTYKGYRELLPVRNAKTSYATDNCDTALIDKDRFADRISYAVELKMQPSIAQINYIASYFGLKKDINSYAPNSLISHPLCAVTSKTLKETLNGKKVPTAATIKKINEFANRMNGYRREALAGSREGYVKASKLWSKFMMCLSYMESLTSADTAKAQQVADKYAPRDYRRPAGVNFYEDPYQKAESRLNIGLYQFTPSAKGNIQSCIREWNLLYPKCGIPVAASQAVMIRILGSSLQTFNAFCGAAKVTGMFSVQVNTSKAANTHPYNVNSNGNLKAPEERCVSPHMSTSRSYNHFGPFQNTSGNNLDTIMSCTLKGE